MALVADESVDYRIIKALRDIGISVYSIIDMNPASNDREVLQIAVGRNCLLITQDKDFGELVFRMQLPHHGVLLIRLAGMKPDEYFWIAQTIHHHFDSLHGCFSVCTGKKLRFRRT